jgi:Holliday junction DNA helicase RuvA
VLELKDKIAKQVFASSSPEPVQAPISFAKSSNLSEALDALVVLGYSKAEAQRALGGIDPSLDVTKIIPLALAKLMR